MYRVIFCLGTEHDLRLVLLAGLVCFLTSFAAVSLFQRAKTAQATARAVWLGVAGVATGCGIWATHFIAMLAYDPGQMVAYDLTLTVLSLFAAIAVTSAGLVLAVDGQRSSAAVGGGVVGAGVACMHYLGMFALQVPGDVVWSPDLVVASIVLGVLLGAAAFIAAHRDDSLRGMILAAALLTLAIVSHHFTAMGALNIIPNPLSAVSPYSLSPVTLSLAIAGVASAVLGICLIVAISDRRTREKINERNLLLDGALNNMSQGLCMFDADNRLLIWNRRYVDMYRIAPDKIRVGNTIRDLLEARVATGTFRPDYQPYERELREAMAQKKLFAQTLELPDGRVISVINQPATNGGWVATHEDITDRKRDEAQIAHMAADMREQSAALIQETEERRRLFETSLDLIFITDRRGQFIRVSPSSAAILGYSPEEMIGHNAIEFICADDLENTRTEMRLARSGRLTRNFETRYVHKDDYLVTLAWSGVWSEPEQRHFFMGRDVTEHKKAEAKLKYLAHYDQLTGLPNRVTLQRELADMIARSREPSGRPISIAMLDLDGFKDINDTLGHSVGDLLLKEVAQRLTEIAEDIARVFRLGGDEFVVTFPDCGDPREVAQSVDMMLRRLAERFEISGQLLYIGASAGIAIAPADGSNVEDLIANADLALYDAKSSGGHTYRLFMPVLRAQAQARRELDSELRRAFTENEFELYFQPQLRLRDNAVVGAEALLRWRHPERGILGPGAFIAALAESPVVHGVGTSILRTACERTAEWQRMGLPPIRIGVNLFPAQLHDGTLLEDVEAVLAQTGLAAEALELEITENIALGHDEALLAPLRALRKKGVGLAFDDFGTGYASLSYLTRYPLSRIKIDQSFVRKITDNREDTAIVRSLIVMAHNLGLEVIAEGVETRAQAAFLQAEGCEEVQGFLYAKPLAAAAFEDFLRSNQAGWKERAGGLANAARPAVFNRHAG